MRKIDAHAHFGIWNFPIPGVGTTDNLLRLCDKYDVEAVACSSSLAILYDMQEGNAELAEAFAPHDQLLGYVYVNPNFIEESVADMETYLPEAQFIGAKIYTGGYSGVDAGDPRFAEMVSEVAKRTTVMLVHTGSAATARHLAGYCEEHPSLNIIMGHAAGTESDIAAELAATHPNLYLEFCCSWAGNGKVGRAIDICGSRQIVYGTDVDLIDPAFLIGTYEDAGLTADQKRDIYYENSARLFGLTLQS